MGENPRHSSCVNRSSTRSPTNRTQVPTLPPPPGDLCTPAFQIEEQLNGVYGKRIAEIEQQTDGDASLKEVTYAEWIDMLRQVNKTLIVNIQELERETSERLSLLQRKVGSNCRFSQDSELNKYRNDVAGLIQLVRNGRRSGDWSVDKLHFETITERDIFGNESSYCDPPMKSETEATNPPCVIDEKVNFECQKAKLTANVKALAFEVAEKHDEIRDLKKQILSMEDEIQKAQKKIQLKDDVIKELRNDLKSLPKCNNLWGVRVVERTPSNLCTPKMPIKSSESFGTDVSAICRPGEPFSNRESINSLNCGSGNMCNISLSDDDEEEQEYIKCLKEELSQLFEMRRNYDQNVDEQRRALKEKHDRLNDMVDKLLKSNSDFQKKLKFYRRELLDLKQTQSSRTLTNCSDVDSGISSDSDVDIKIINSIRGLFTCLMEKNQCWMGEQQRMHMKYEDANGRAVANSQLLDKTSKALREVVDALTNAICKPIAYDKIFGDCQNVSVNPIVEAVDELIETLKEKDKTISELQKQISTTGKINKELESGIDKLGTECVCDIKELMSAHTRADCCGRLMWNEEFCKRVLKQAEKYQEENSGTEQEHHSEYLRIIDDLSSELNTLSRQVNMVQRDFPGDEVAKQFENSLKGLETQNDLLQSAVESLIQERETIQRTLQAQNEELKSRLCEQEEELCDLENQLHQLRQRPCQTCGNRSQMDNSHRTSRRDEKRPDSMEELQKMEYELRRISKSLENLKSENTRLKEELAETRRYQAKMKLLQRRGVMSAVEKANEEQLLSRLSAAENESKAKSKSLQKALKEISYLQQEVDDLRQAEETFNKERELLQVELIALKETQAAQIGKEKSLQVQLQGTMTELYAAKGKLQETVQLKDRIDSLCREVKRFEEINADMFKKYNNLVEEYNNAIKEYQKVVQIEEEKSNQIRALKAWKKEQLQSERQVFRKIQMYENHFKSILEDKQNLLDKLNETESDNRDLLQVIERLRGQKGNQSQSLCSPSGCYSGVASVSNDPVSQIIENVRSASRRLSQQRSVLHDEACRLFSQSK